MAKIHIRGRKEPLEIADEQARNLQEALKTADGREVVQVGLLSVRASEVKLVEILEEPKDDTFARQFQKWSDERSTFLRRPITEKVEKVMGGFMGLLESILQYSFDKETVKEKLAQWFDEPKNHYRTMPDVTLFSGMIPSGHTSGRKTDKYSMRALDGILATVAEDKRIAKEQEGWKIAQAVHTHQPQQSPVAHTANPIDLPF